MSIFGNDLEELGNKKFGRIYPPNEKWLSKGADEEIIEPELEIIDAHHHLWDMPKNEYLVRDFFDDVNTGHNIISTVFVECMAMYKKRAPEPLKPVGETEFAAGMAAMSESGQYGDAAVAKSIVGFADLSLGDKVRPVLERHLSVGDKRFKGVRFSTSWDADPEIGNSHTGSHNGLLLDTVVLKGISHVDELNLSLDVWVFHPQLSEVAKLADHFPNLNMVLGHCGGPLGYGIYKSSSSDVFKAWKSGMESLAKRPNISVKLGGMMMRLAAFDYLSSPLPPSSDELLKLWKPYVETCIELFGPKRCMFESNFPVEKMGVGYSTLWNAFKKITLKASTDEKQWLYSNVAKKVYRM